MLSIWLIQLNIKAVADRNCGNNFKSVIFKWNGLSSWEVKLLGGEWHRIYLMVIQTLIQVMNLATMQQAITRENVDQDLWIHMAPLGQNRVNVELL